MIVKLDNDNNDKSIIYAGIEYSFINESIDTNFYLDLNLYPLLIKYDFSSTTLVFSF